MLRRQRRKTIVRKLIDVHRELVETYPSYTRCAFSIACLISVPLGMFLNAKPSWSAAGVSAATHFMFGTLGYLMGACVGQCLQVADKGMGRSTQLGAFIGFSLAACVIGAARSDMTVGSQYVALVTGLGSILGVVFAVEALSFSVAKVLDCCNGDVNS